MSVKSIACGVLFGLLLISSSAVAQIQGGGSSIPVPQGDKSAVLQGPDKVNEAEAKIMIHAYVKALFDANSAGMDGIIGFPHAVGETCVIASTMAAVKKGMSSLKRSGSFKLGAVTPITDRTKLGDKMRSKYTYLATNVPTCSDRRAQALESKAIKMPRRYYLVEVTDEKGKTSNVVVRLSYYKKKWHVTGGA